jgi:hypothetical protein
MRAWASVTRTVDIYEVPNGWYKAGKRKPYKNAVSALKAIKTENKRLAQNTGKTVITYLNWHPTTRIGTAVIKALANVVK